MLEQFGLSNYENKVYLSLLQLGIADARSISNESDVPYGRIYDTLGTLFRRGIINEISGRPKKFTVVEPELAIERLVESKQQELKNLEKSAELTSQELTKRYNRVDHDELIWKVAIGQDLYDTYFDLLAESKKQFFTYFEVNEAAMGDAHYFEEYRALLSSLEAKGVEIRVILGLDDPSIIDLVLQQSPEVFTILSQQSIRWTTTKHVSFSIIDGKKVLLKVTNPIRTEEFLAGIYLKQDSLATTLKASFLDLWEESSELQLKLELDH